MNYPAPGGALVLMLTICVMTNKQRTFVNSGLGLTLFFLTLGTATSFPLYVVASEVSIAQQTRTVTGMVTDEKGDPLLGVNVEIFS